MLSLHNWPEKAVSVQSVMRVIKIAHVEPRLLVLIAQACRERDPVAAYSANQSDLRTSVTSFIYVATLSVNAALIIYSCILYWLGFVTVLSWLYSYVDQKSGTRGCWIEPRLFLNS